MTQVFVGKQVYDYEIVALKSAIKLNLATGMIPTRGVGPKKMLARAAQLTGKTYKLSQRQQAIDDLQALFDKKLSEKASA
jgi:hypothetical protein